MKLILFLGLDSSESDLSVLMLKSMFACEVLIKVTISEAIKALESHANIDLIISDFYIHDGTATSFLDFLQEGNYRVPFVFYSNMIGNKNWHKYPHFFGFIPIFKPETFKVRISKLLQLENIKLS